MLKGTTESGFAYEIPDETLNDYELFELIAEVDTNPLLLPKLVVKLLGEDQKKSLMDHVRNEYGIVKIDSMSQEVMEIFKSKELKNS